MAVTNKPWNGDASKYSSASEYCNACLIDNNPPGKDKIEGLCKLPVKEPNGDINSNGVHAAAAALGGARGGVKASPADKKAAAKKLLGMYRVMKQDPPPSIKNMST